MLVKGRGTIMNSSSLILVVLYNKDVDKSESLKSLLNIKNISADILIFNNGPKRLEQNSSFIKGLEEKYKKVYVAEDVQNRPLSVLYNGVLTEYKRYKTFYIFDDDTFIPNDFFTKTIDKIESNDLVIPQIISDTEHSVCYPLINGVPYDRNTGIKSTDTVYSIGSGLVISLTLIEKFERSGIDLFDNRYALYGVDFSLFRRIRSLMQAGMKINIAVAGSLNHSLAKRKKNKESWRKQEITIDQVLTSKFYTKGYLGFMWVLIKKLLKFDFANFYLACKIYKLGCHPRSNKYL